MYKKSARKVLEVALIYNVLAIALLKLPNEVCFLYLKANHIRLFFCQHADEFTQTLNPTLSVDGLSAMLKWTSSINAEQYAVVIADEIERSISAEDSYSFSSCRICNASNISITAINPCGNLTEEYLSTVVDCGSLCDPITLLNIEMITNNIGKWLIGS